VCMGFHGRWRRRHRHRGWYERRWGRWGPRWNGPGRLRGRRLRQRLEHRLPRHSLSGGVRVGEPRGSPAGGHRRSRWWRSRMRWLHSRRGAVASSRVEPPGASASGEVASSGEPKNPRLPRPFLQRSMPSSLPKRARARAPGEMAPGVRRTHWLLGLGLSLSIGHHRRRICPPRTPRLPAPRAI
jgi:hypothetical protein